jgi:hypothetical protein
MQPLISAISHISKNPTLGSKSIQRFLSELTAPRFESIRGQQTRSSATLRSGYGRGYTHLAAAQTRRRLLSNRAA